MAGKAAASSIEGCVGGFLRYASGMANWPRTAERIAPALAIGGVCFLFVASLIGAPKLEPGATERASPVGSGAATPKKRYSLAAIGDSLTDKKSQGGKYLEYLQEKCPKSRFDSWGKGGNMVSQMRKRFAMCSAKARRAHGRITATSSYLAASPTSARTRRQAALPTRSRPI